MKYLILVIMALTMACGGVITIPLPEGDTTNTGDTDQAGDSDVMPGDDTVIDDGDSDTVTPGDDDSNSNDGDTDVPGDDDLPDGDVDDPVPDPEPEPDPFTCEVGELVVFCHCPQGNMDNPQSIEVPCEDALNHMEQHEGDYVGECE